MIINTPVSLGELVDKISILHIKNLNINDIEKLKLSIGNAMKIKPKGHEFDLNEKPMIFRHMNVTGG